jgi:FKBP-type peptidyl-prolyl cis-trans isomerase FkpA
MKGFNNTIMFRLLVFCLVLVSFTACKKDEKTLEENIAEINEYIADNNLTDVQKTESGLHYIVTKEGDGYYPDINSTVNVSYKGYLTDNSIFDQNPNSEFPLKNVIEGWQEGIPKFSRGGGGILLIPSTLGYGASATGSIPANSVLIFEVDLINF